MQNNVSYKSSGIVTTIIFHGTIILLFLYFGFRTPLPLPAEEGILVNFGETEMGQGVAEPLPNQASKPVETEKETPPPVEEDKAVLTQSHEDAPSLKEKEVVIKKKKEVKPVKKVEKEVTKPKTEVKPVVVERKANPLALYKGKGTTESSSEGITEGKGNQGSTQGTANSKNYTGSGMGNSGISYSLDGRIAQTLPSPEYSGQSEGVVVVDIIVDKDGKVTQANAGVKGSTTLEKSLVDAAKRAALQSVFKRNPDAPAYQKGTIKYRFKLQ